MPDAEDIAVPVGVELRERPGGLRLVGTAVDVSRVLEQFRTLSTQPEGTVVGLGQWKLLVTDTWQPDRLRVIGMPSQAWAVAASVLIGACYDEYATPFDFGDVGYLKPAPQPDIGVEIVPDSDWLGA